MYSCFILIQLRVYNRFNSKLENYISTLLSLYSFKTTFKLIFVIASGLDFLNHQPIYLTIPPCIPPLFFRRHVKDARRTHDLLLCYASPLRGPFFSLDVLSFNILPPRLRPLLRPNPSRLLRSLSPTRPNLLELRRIRPLPFLRRRTNERKLSWRTSDRICD